MQRILAETDRALDAVGIVNGVSHTEIIVEAGGRCVIVEAGARIPGFPIGELVSLAVGVDLSRAAVDIALSRPVRITRTCDQYATARFFFGNRAGTITSISNLPEIGPTVPAVHLKRRIGDHVGAMASNRDRIGHFIVTGRKASEVEAEAESLLSRVRLEIGADGDARDFQEMEGELL